ncbi:MAG: Branched-chain amino acid transport ATP-binding protein LivG, partial [Nocardioidaceae bacterium]|nr:Branched-chain amino acid transport ATP-binding protein LivG [Nocardioidaceae bacterium]
VGGMTTGIGPVLGVIVMLGAPQVLSWLDNYRDLVSGVVIVLVVALAPSGLGGALTRAVRSRTRRRRSDVVAEAESEMISIEQGDVGVIIPLPVADLSLDVVDVERHFGGVKAVQGVSFDVRAGEVFGLIGPNGSGKSTMLNLLSGVYKPGAGDVVLGGTSLKPHFGNQAWLSRRGVSRTFQNIRLIDDLTVEENILLGGYARLGGGLTASRQVRAEMRTLASDFGLGEILDQDPSSLPYGLQRRVEICRALLSHPQLLMLDEPTAGMTPAERADVFSAIRTVAHRGILVIVVEHDVESMLANCDRIATLNFGKLIALGKPKDVIESEAVIEAYVGHAARG